MESLLGFHLHQAQQWHLFGLDPHLLSSKSKENPPNPRLLFSCLLRGAGGEEEALLSHPPKVFPSSYFEALGIYRPNKKAQRFYSSSSSHAASLTLFHQLTQKQGFTPVRGSLRPAALPRQGLQGRCTTMKDAQCDHLSYHGQTSWW